MTPLLGHNEWAMDAVGLAFASVLLLDSCAIAGV
jgi:hypothetical protein